MYNGYENSVPPVYANNPMNIQVMITISQLIMVKHMLQVIMMVMTRTYTI